jgi:hypothetical protein
MNLITHYLHIFTLTIFFSIIIANPTHQVIRIKKISIIQKCPILKFHLDCVFSQGIRI